MYSLELFFCYFEHLLLLLYIRKSFNRFDQRHTKRPGLVIIVICDCPKTEAWSFGTMAFVVSDICKMGCSIEYYTTVMQFVCREKGKRMVKRRTKKETSRNKKRNLVSSRTRTCDLVMRSHEEKMVDVANSHTFWPNWTTETHTSALFNGEHRYGRYQRLHQIYNLSPPLFPFPSITIPPCHDRTKERAVAVRLKTFIINKNTFSCFHTVLGVKEWLGSHLPTCSDLAPYDSHLRRGAKAQWNLSYTILQWDHPRRIVSHTSMYASYPNSPFLDHF